MKIVRKIFNCLILFSLSLPLSVLAEVDSRYIEQVQFVSPQKETRDPSIEELSRVPLYLYSMLFSTIKMYKATSQRCSAYYRPSSSEITELNNANKLLKDLNDCYKTKTGIFITEDMVSEHLNSDPNTRLINLLSNADQLDKSGINPNSVKDMEKCAQNINTISTPMNLIPWQKATGYPSKGWCEKLK